uniref:DEP domain-containing protein 1A-like n=1 Tax=Petromyzon marinus TaxID=7757 RepID=A0AAJ7TPY8_PETMA|nr:DEP domain-containing protein 1A-like [Petromyzon marinus]
MQDQRLISPGPYRATKLWGEVTRLFRAGMPVRRHRLHLRSHDRCFTAAEAADWLHALLRDNRNFGPTVTREQTLQLLGKFLKNHVVEDVKGRWGTEAVRDDSKLYRFPVASPAKSMSGGSRQPLSERNSGSVARRRLGLKADAPPSLWSGSTSPARAKATFNPDEWRNVALALLCEALSLPSLAGLLDPASVDPTHIMRNVQGAGRRGLVILQDDTDDLPHWVLTAMKCLANWPGSEAGRSESYPGFERDVFGSVSQHFCSLADPLLTFPLYRLFVGVLVLTGYVLEEEPPPPPAHRERRPTEPLARRDQRWAPPPPPPILRRTPTPTLAPAHLPWASAENLLLSFTSAGNASDAVPAAPFRRAAPVRVKRHDSVTRAAPAGDPPRLVRPAPRPAPLPLHRGRSHHALAVLEEEEVDDGDGDVSPWAPAQRCFSLDSLAAAGSAELPTWVRPVGRAESFLLKRLQQQQPKHQQLQQYHHYQQQQQYHHYQQQQQYHQQQQQYHQQQQQLHHQQQHHQHQQYQQYPQYHRQQHQQHQQQLGEAGDPERLDQDVQEWGTTQRPRSWHTCLPEYTGDPRWDGGFGGVAGGGTSRSPPPERRSSAEPRPRVASLSACERRMQAGRRRAASCADVHGAARADAGWGRRGGLALGASAGDLGATPSPTPSPTPSYLGVQSAASGPTLVPSPEGAGREAACVAALRVCCLLLPPPSRRRLQLVTRMAARAIANGRLPPLHTTRGTRAHIVESLAPCVLRARDGEGAEGDALVSARLLTLLVENHGEVLFSSIPEPLARLARGESSAERTPPRMQELLEDHSPSPIRLRSHTSSPIRPITGLSEHPRRSASDGSVSPRDRRKRSQEYPASPRLQQLDAQRPRDAAKGPARTRPNIKPPLLLLAMTKPFKRKSSLRC